jgi:hypothetical protein
MAEKQAAERNRPLAPISKNSSNRGYDQSAATGRLQKFKVPSAKFKGKDLCLLSL